MRKKRAIRYFGVWRLAFLSFFALFIGTCSFNESPSRYDDVLISI